MKTLTKEQALSRVDQIDGWLTMREAGTLYDLATKAQGPIVEIGSWQGRSTAALALGSMAGNMQPVYAIDSYEGVPPLDRKTERGIRPGWNSSSPEIVRANLDRAGVNGLVKIIPKPSQHAVEDIPGCDVLFIDGGHDYDSISRDLRLYLPKVQEGGLVVLHDCYESDPDVMRAFEEFIAQDPKHWCVQGRIDSAMVCKRKKVESYSVFLAIPGGSLTWGVARGFSSSSLGAHKVLAMNSSNGWDDMNMLWTEAQNCLEQGKITHFAMLHNDVEPVPGWLDILIAELDSFEADLVSTVVPLKDKRGITSTAIGEPGDPWRPLRRLTIREVAALPPTFGIEDTAHPDKVLLHNTGCWACDLRNPAFREVDEQGRMRCTFDFPIESRRNFEGLWIHNRESEDWHFSRAIHEVGIRGMATTKVPVFHVGFTKYPNTGVWGTYENGDEDTADRWRTEGAESCKQS